MKYEKDNFFILLAAFLLILSLVDAPLKAQTKDQNFKQAQKLVEDATQLSAAKDVESKREAVSKLEEAKRLFHEISDKKDEADVIYKIASNYEVLDDVEKAKDYYEQSLILSREFKNRSLEGDTLRGLGNVYYRRLVLKTEVTNYSEQSQIIKSYYEQGLAISREIKDKNLESKMLGNLGNLYFLLGQRGKSKDYLKTALEYYEQAVIIRREFPDKTLEGNFLHSLGNIYANLSQYETAGDYLERSLKIKRETKDRRGEDEVLDGLETTYTRLAQYEKAKDYAEQSLIIKKELKNRRGEGGILYDLGAFPTI